MLFSKGWGATNVETKSAASELWPPDPRRHIMPILTMSQSRTHHGKHICQHTPCVLTRTMCKLTTHKLSSLTCRLPFEVSSTWACHYKSISLVRKIKNRFPHFALFKRLGCNKCGNQVCCLGALAPGSSITHHPYPHHVTDEDTAQQAPA